MENISHKWVNHTSFIDKDGGCVAQSCSDISCGVRRYFYWGEGDNAKYAKGFIQSAVEVVNLGNIADSYKKIWKVENET